MIPQLQPFRAVHISRLAHQLMAEGQSVIQMHFGQPSTGAPAAAIAAAHRVLDTDGMGYWESAPLKQAIAARYLERDGVSIDPGRILLTCGASPALVLALLSGFKPGDRIAYARPGYPAYRNNLIGLSMVPVEIPCGPDTRYQLTAAAIEALDPAPAGLIIASPANPTGTIIDADELAVICATCTRREIAIIADEIYHGLSYTGSTPSILQFAPDAAVVNSFSKYFSMAGWRLGWLVAPDAWIDRATALMSNLFLTAPSLAQHAGLAAMGCTGELDGHVDTYRANRAMLLDALPAMGLARIAPPDGAFYIYADIGHLSDDSFAFCERLLRETGVATAPGVDFDSVDGHRTMRFSFAVSTDRVEQAIARLVPWFARQPARAGIAVAL